MSARMLGLVMSDAQSHDKQKVLLWTGLGVESGGKFRNARQV